MRNFFGKFMLAGVVVGAAFAVYQFLLPEEAKENLHHIAQKGVEIGNDVRDTILGKDTADEQSRIDANRSYVAQQWEQAGF